VLDRARGVVVQSRAGLREALVNSRSLTVLEGHARFEGRERNGFRLRVGNRGILASQVVIDTGTRSRIPRIHGLGAIDFLTAENWIDRPELPRHLAVLGGGYTGLEMAQFYRRMGSRVTVIEKGPEIAAHEDEDVARALRQILESEEIAFRLETSAERVDGDGAGLRLSLTTKRKREDLVVSHLLVATGRKPNTDDLGLESIGLATAKDGTIEVTKRLSTKVRGVWAAGDVRGGPMFTHTAWDDYRILASQLAGDGSRTTERIVPYAIYTDPQLGRVGMTVADAKKSGRKIRVGRYELRKNARAKEFGETEGFIQVVTDARSDRILGVAVLCAEGAELVHLFVDVMNAKGRSAAIRDAIHVHPTFAEAVQSAVSALK